MVKKPWACQYLDRCSDNAGNWVIGEKRCNKMGVRCEYITCPFHYSPMPGTALGYRGYSNVRDAMLPFGTV